MSKDSVIYLDHAAATPIDETVVAAMQPYFVERFYNPSATYLAAQQVRKDIEAARASVAHWLGSRPTEITFTAGGSEANNLAIHGVMRAFPDSEVVVSAIEHDSVLQAAQQHANRITAVMPDGRVDVAALRANITDSTVLVSIMYANNEIGTIQPLSEVVAVIESIRAERKAKKHDLPLYLHVDACQASNYLSLNVARLGVDLMTINGGKLYGPKQSGCLYVKAGTRLLPLIDGGGQEHGLRSGTENVAAIIGFAKALDRAQTMRQSEAERLRRLQQQWFAALQKAIPDTQINGSQKHRLPNNLHITLASYDNERLIMELDEAGIQAAAGSACSASDEEPSHVLKAIGLSDIDAQSSLRLTMGRETTEADLARLLMVLVELTK